MQCYYYDTQVLYDTWLSAYLPTSTDDVAVDWNGPRLRWLVSGQCFWQSQSTEDVQSEEQ